MNAAAAQYLLFHESNERTVSLLILVNSYVTYFIHFKNIFKIKQK